MKKKILVFLVTIISLVGFVVLKEVKAGSGDSVYGWAWSDNIGWISFNCDNPELASCGTSNYGVNIDSSGNFSGYAWAGGGENADGSLAATIGWISFNSADLAGCPSLPCEAKLDLGTYEVSGWARALAFGDGWEGWIKLRGAWEDGVSFNTSTNEFEGWAWGDDVIGWISFNCSNEASCRSSDYKVMADLSQSPDKPTTEDESWGVCGGMPQIAFRTSVTLNWQYFDPEGDPQRGYKVWVDEDRNFIGPKFNNLVTHAPLSGHDFGYSLDLTDDEEGDWLSELSWGSTYYWKVMVKDINDKWSEFSDTDSFTIPNRASPNAGFTADPINPGRGERVDFTDSSKCYELDEDTEYDCKTGTTPPISYSWDFGDGETTSQPIDEPMGNTTHTYSDLGSYIVRLEVTDSAVGLGIGMCWQEMNVGIPLPEWKEIAPF